jgi:hypothetical protein
MNSTITRTKSLVGDCIYCNSEMAQIAAIQRHHLIQPRRRAAPKSQMAIDQSQSNQSSVVEMLVDWLFEKNEHCEQREPTATENSRIFSFFGTWVAITNFIHLNWGELLGFEVHIG